MLSQATALDYLTTYQSAYAPLFEDGVQTPRSATLHTPQNRNAADAAGKALVAACRPLARTLWKNHAFSVDEADVESFILDIVLVRSFIYDPAKGAKFTTWFSGLLRNAMIDNLRDRTQSRDLDDPYREFTASPIGDDDDRSLFDTTSSSFMSSTTMTPEEDIESMIPGILDRVRERAEKRELDADLIVRVTVSYLLSRYGRAVGTEQVPAEKLVTRADVSAETDLSTHATRKATDAAEDILRRVLTNQPEDDRKTA